MLTWNQLSSIVSERKEAEATVMEQGVNLLANFPLPSPFIFFWLRKFAEIFLSIAVRQGIFARLLSFRKRGFPATVCMPGEPPFSWNTSRDWTKPSQFKVTSMSCMIHTDPWNLQCVWQSAPRSHLLVAASVTLMKLNRALQINKKATRSRLRQATTRIAVCLQQTITANAAYLRLVCSSECFQGWFFKVYANNHCRSF